MNKIGEWGELLSKLTLEQFLRRKPPAVLMKSIDAGSFEAGEEDPGATLFRMEPDDEHAMATALRDLSDKNMAYTVLALGPSGAQSTERLLVGCIEPADLVVNDASVSRKHAWIERDGDTYVLEDAGSTIGTRINGKRLLTGQKHTLMTGEQVTLGEVGLTYLDASNFYKFVKAFLGT